MIATAKTSRRKAHQRRLHQRFLEMLPGIRRDGAIAFRSAPQSEREDLVQEVVANAYCAFVRLVERSKADAAYASPLAAYAVRQVRCGRRVGSRLNGGDVLSPYAQRLQGIVVQRLDRFDQEEGAWIEAVVPDDRRPVPDQAAFRVDFPAWLQGHNRRMRRLAEALAVGEQTTEVARRFGITAGRVSQLRRELAASWAEFHGETPGPEHPSPGLCPVNCPACC